jgi:hypothetical protein
VALPARLLYAGKAVARDILVTPSFKVALDIERARLWKSKLVRLGGQGLAHCRLDSVPHPARVLSAGQAAVTSGPSTRVFCSQLRQ